MYLTASEVYVRMVCIHPQEKQRKIICICTMMPMAVWYEFYVHTYLSEQFLAPSTIVRGEVDMHVVVLGRQRFLHERFAEHFTTHHYSILRLAHFICSGEGRGGKGLLSLHLISLQCAGEIIP